MVVFRSNSEEETERLGCRIGERLDKGGFVALYGELGAGKTAFVRGLAAGLGAEGVTSPTFTLMHEYEGRLPLYHFDAYRLTYKEEAEELGFEEYFFGNGVSVVEWAENIRGILPHERLDIEITSTGEHTREIAIRPSGSGYWKIAAEVTG
jgi:tRNA threonylcarbamoyladenosine biosynthesis protein TsaE